MRLLATGSYRAPSSFLHGDIESGANCHFVAAKMQEAVRRDRELPRWNALSSDTKEILCDFAMGKNRSVAVCCSLI
jgi:hypothetical protein